MKTPPFIIAITMAALFVWATPTKANVCGYACNKVEIVPHAQVINWAGSIPQLLLQFENNSVFDQVCGEQVINTLDWNEIRVNEMPGAVSVSVDLKISGPMIQRIDALANMQNIDFGEDHSGAYYILYGVDLTHYFYQVEGAAGRRMLYTPRMDAENCEGRSVTEGFYGDPTTFTGFLQGISSLDQIPAFEVLQATFEFPLVEGEACYQQEEMAGTTSVCGFEGGDDNGGIVDGPDNGPGHGGADDQQGSDDPVADQPLQQQPALPLTREDKLRIAEAIRRNPLQGGIRPGNPMLRAAGRNARNERGLGDARAQLQREKATWHASGDIDIYPNPTDAIDGVTLTGLQVDQSALVQVMDMTGRTVIEEAYTGHGGTVWLSTQSLLPGSTYFVAVSIGEAVSTQRLVVK